MYTIEERDPDPKFGRVVVVWFPLLDGPLEPYIKSKNLIVKDKDGKEVLHAEDGDS